MSNDHELDARAHQLLVIWNKANNYFNTFAIEFYKVRQEFENHDTYLSFGAWLLSKTELDESMVINRIASFGDTLATETKETNNAAKEQLDKENRVAREKKTKEDIRAQYQNETRKQDNKNDYQRRQPANADPIDEIFNLVAQIKNAMIARKMGREQWIRGTRDLALLLVKAKETFPNTKDFSNWLQKYKIDLSSQERAALIQLGYQPNLEAILQQTDSFSVELIWRKVRKESPIVSMP